MAFDVAFYIAYTIMNELQEMLQQSAALKMMADRPFLFHSFAKYSIMREKRSMVDLKDVKECYEKLEINDFQAYRLNAAMRMRLKGPGGFHFKRKTA